MRILICSDIYPGLRGIAKYAESIAEILKRNNNITILCSGEKNKRARENIKGVNIVRISYNGPENFKNIEKFMHENRNNFDIVIVCWYIYLKSAIKNFKKTIYVLPSLRKVSLQFEGRNWKDASYFEKEAMKECNHIVYPSLNLKQQAEKAYNVKKGLVIPHGVNVNEFTPLSSSKKKQYQVVTIANFDPRKGIDKLFKVAEFSKGEFNIIGDGKEKEEYTEKIKSSNLNIKLKGQLESKKVAEFLRLSQIYVLPSRYEAFGLVILEAMASGLPVIAFKPDGKNIITASSEIIKDGKTGFLVKDEREMAQKIDLLLKNDKLREKMGKAARQEAENYKWEKAVNKILNLIKYGKKKQK